MEAFINRRIDKEDMVYTFTSFLWLSNITHTHTHTNTMEYYSAIKKELKFTIYDKMDRHGGLVK